MAATVPIRKADVDPAPPRPRGRPRNIEPGSTISTWVSASEHDRLLRLAQRREESLSATVRRLLILRLP
jgi:hypothetical protein